MGGTGRGNMWHTDSCSGLQCRTAAQAYSAALLLRLKVPGAATQVMQAPRALATAPYQQPECPSPASRTAGQPQAQVRVRPPGRAQPPEPPWPTGDAGPIQHKVEIIDTSSPNKSWAVGPESVDTMLVQTTRTQISSSSQIDCVTGYKYHKDHE